MLWLRLTIKQANRNSILFNALFDDSMKKMHPLMKSVNVVLTVFFVS